MLLQCVAVCCSVLQCVAVRFEVDLMCYCSVMQCVAVCCSVLQCVAAWFEVDRMCSPSSLIQSDVSIVYFCEDSSAREVVPHEK